MNNPNELTKLEKVALEIITSRMYEWEKCNNPFSEYTTHAFHHAQQFLDASPDKGLANLGASLRELDKHMIQQPPVSDPNPCVPEEIVEALWGFKRCQTYEGSFKNDECWVLLDKALTLCATKSSYVAAGSVPIGVIEKLNAIKAVCASEPASGLKGNIWKECDDALKLCESATTPDTKPCVPKEVVDILHIIGQETLNYRIKTLAEKALTLCATPYVDPRVKELEELNIEAQSVVAAYLAKIKQLEMQRYECGAYNKRIQKQLDDLSNSAIIKHQEIVKLESQRNEAVKTLENLIAYPQVAENRIISLLKNLKGEAK
jgi:hypothetical protein